MPQFVGYFVYEGEQREVVTQVERKDRDETLRIANERTRDDTNEPPPARFNTLLAALEKTGLADRLQGGGSYTLFAPTGGRRLPRAARRAPRIHSTRPPEDAAPLARSLDRRQLRGR